MVNFKLCISDPSSGRTFQKDVKDEQAKPFLGMNIGEPVKGEAFDFSGYEFTITGGSDYCGFPMRKGILGLRKKITIYGGVGFRGGARGIKRRKTVCGHKIYDKTSQINLKVTKHGSKKLAEIFGVEDKKEAKAEKADKKAEEPKEKKAEANEEKKEHKPEEKKHETHPKEHVPEEKKHEAHHKEHKEEKKE